MVHAVRHAVEGLQEVSIGLAMLADRLVEAQNQAAAQRARNGIPRRS